MTAVGDARKRSQDAAESPSAIPQRPASPQVDPDATATPVGAQGGDLDVASLREDIRSVRDDHNPDPTAEWWAEKADLLLTALDEARAEVERLRRGGKSLGDTLVFWTELAVKVTGSEDCIEDDGDGDYGAVAERLAELPIRLTAAESARDAAEGALGRVRVRVEALADSIHGDSGWEHNGGCEGEPDCFACIELDLRAALDPAVPASEGGDGK